MLTNIPFVACAAFLLLASVADGARLTYSFSGNMAVGLWRVWDRYHIDGTLPPDEPIKMVGSDTAEPFRASREGEFGLDVMTKRVDFGFGLSGNVGRYSGYGQVGPKLFNHCNHYAYACRVNRLFVTWRIADSLSLLYGIHQVPSDFLVRKFALYWSNGCGDYTDLDFGSKPMLRFAASGKIGTRFGVTGKVAMLRADTMMLPICGFATKDTTVVDAAGHPTPMAVIVRNKFYLDDWLNTIKYTMPKIEASLDFNFDWKMLHCNPRFAGGYQEYEIVHKEAPLAGQIEGGEAKQMVRSYLFGGMIDARIGPVTLGYACAGGQNLGIFGVNTGSSRMLKGSGYSFRDIFYPCAKAADLDGKLLEPGDLIPIDKKDDVTIFENSSAYKMAWMGKLSPWKWLAFGCGYGFIGIKHGNGHRSRFWRDTHAWFGEIDYTLFRRITLAPTAGQYIHRAEYTTWTCTYAGLVGNIAF